VSVSVEEAGVADERHDAAFVVGAVLGGVAGAAYGLFSAPQAGRRTRGQLAEQGDAVVQRLADGVAALRAQTGSAAAQVGETVEGLVGRGHSPDRDDTNPIVVDAEPVFTLPDPLEPDPIVATDPDTDLTADRAPVMLGAPEADVVVDDPRQATDGPPPASG